MTWLDPVFPGDVVLLSGTSGKGKNRVRELGNRWIVERVSHVALLVFPEYQRDHDARYERWVRPVGDEHFAIDGVERRSAA